MSRVGAAIVTGLIVMVIVALVAAGIMATMTMQDSICHSRGGERVPTGGFNFICVSPDGKVLP